MVCVCVSKMFTDTVAMVPSYSYEILSAEGDGQISADSWL